MCANHILSAVCCFVGLLSLMAGLEKTGRAANCTEVEHNSKFCDGAHLGAPIENASGSYCELDAGGTECVATSGSSCVDRYGVVYSGKCEPHVLGTGTTYDCFEDAVQTVLVVPFYTSHCVADGSGCACVWTKTTTTQPVTTCDCYDVEQEL